MTDFDDDQSFERASQSDSGGLLADLVAFMGENKKWWLLPILIVLGLLGTLVWLSGVGGALPFLYTLF